MRCSIRRLLREPEGQDIAEYGIAMAVIAVGAALAAAAIAANINTLWEQANAVIAITGS